jgi:nitrate reductase gamma subunit
LETKNKRILGGTGLLTSGAAITAIALVSCIFPDTLENIVRVAGSIFGVAVLIAWATFSIRALIKSDDSLRQVLGGIGLASWGAFLVTLCVFPEVRESSSIIAGSICGTACLLAWPIFSFRAILSKE